MTKSGMNLQDSFLNQVRKENTEIMLMLLDGTRLNGFVRGFDNFTVIMSVRGSQHLIYKHAIAQIVSRRPQQHEGERESHAQQAAPAAEGAAPAGEGGVIQAAGTPEAPPQREPRRERREGEGRREERREGEGRPQGEGRREREERREREDASRPKFNTIDFSSIKIEQEKKI